MSLGTEETFEKQRLAALGTEGRLIRSKNQQTETLRLYLGNVNSSNPPGQQEERPQTGGPKGRLFAKLV